MKQILRLDTNTLAGLPLALPGREQLVDIDRRGSCRTKVDLPGLAVRTPSQPDLGETTRNRDPDRNVLELDFEVHSPHRFVNRNVSPSTGALVLDVEDGRRRIPTPTTQHKRHLIEDLSTGRPNDTSDAQVSSPSIECNQCTWHWTTSRESEGAISKDRIAVPASSIDDGPEGSTEGRQQARWLHTARKDESALDGPGRQPGRIALD